MMVYHFALPLLSATQNVSPMVFCASTKAKGEVNEEWTI